MPIYGEWQNPAERMCNNKKTYKTEGYAMKVARWQSEVSGHLIIAFRCWCCTGYHTGHADQSQWIAHGKKVAP